VVTIWSVGHSTRSSEEFNKILLAHRIEALADVRAFPFSRRYPHFNKEMLAPSLAASKIDYEHLPALGGRRKPAADSINTALRNASFRAYADYMETENFREGIENLLRLGMSQPTAMMCAEAVWWRCHRSLISDYLVVQDVKVIHLLSATKSQPHVFSSAASIVKGRLSYAGLLDPKVTS
jgi:uncharacterized protein (DUF488 family)